MSCIGLVEKTEIEKEREKSQTNKQAKKRKDVWTGKSSSVCPELTFFYL